MIRLAALAGGLTLALGASVVVAWGVAGGDVSFRGPLRVLEERAGVIYALVSILAFPIAFVAFDRFGRGLPDPTRIGVVLAAWLGEWFVLFAGALVISSEVTGGPSVTWWVIGTGGPVQPIAAAVGALAAARVRSSGRPSE